MPGRKSTGSEVAPSTEEDKSTEKAQLDGKIITQSVEDYGLPRSMVQRLAKGVLPPNTQIQKDALLAIQKSATVFASMLSGWANELMLAEGKKNIQPQHVMAALEEIEYSAFKRRVEGELKHYGSAQTEKRNDYRRRVKEEKGSIVGGSPAQGGSVSAIKLNMGQTPTNHDGSPPAAKKARTSINGAGVAKEEESDGDTIPDEDQEDLVGEEREGEEEEEDEQEEEEEEEEEDMEEETERDVLGEDEEDMEGRSNGGNASHRPRWSEEDDDKIKHGADDTEDESD